MKTPLKQMNTKRLKNTKKKKENKLKINYDNIENDNFYCIFLDLQ